MTQDGALAGLVSRVSEFYITDRAMKRAQKRMEEAMAAGRIDATEKAAYISAVRRYFSAFQREARAHLRDVDKRLEYAHQVQFNLNAERGVAVRRIEATQRVLAEIDGVADVE